MKSEQPVLIVGDHNAHINTMAERVRDLGHSTVRMKSLDEAINLALERHITFAVATAISTPTSKAKSSGFKTLRRRMRRSKTAS